MAKVKIWFFALIGSPGRPCTIRHAIRVRFNNDLICCRATLCSRVAPRGKYAPGRPRGVTHHRRSNDWSGKQDNRGRGHDHHGGHEYDGLWEHDHRGLLEHVHRCRAGEAARFGGVAAPDAGHDDDDDGDGNPRGDAAVGLATFIFGSIAADFFVIALELVRLAVEQTARKVTPQHVVHDDELSWALG